MELLAVPFIPTHAEYIFLMGRHVLADQMEFLRSHFPRSSPLHARIQGWLNHISVPCTPIPLRDIFSQIVHKQGYRSLGVPPRSPKGQALTTIRQPTAGQFCRGQHMVRR